MTELAYLKPADVRETSRLLLAEYGVEPPAELLSEFGAGAGAGWRPGRDIEAERIWELFEREYLLREPASTLLIRCTARRAGISPADPWIALFNIRQSIGNGQDSPALVVSGFLTAMGLDVSILGRHSQVLACGLTIAYVKCLAGLPAWGVGMGGDLAAASLKAVLSAVNRAGLLVAATAAGNQPGEGGSGEGGSGELLVRGELAAQHGCLFR
jgi:2-isopropylmalate synthase